MIHCINKRRKTMKSKQNSAPSPHPRLLFLKWYHTTPLGQVLQKNEAAYLLNSLQLTYYQKILQVGPLGSENQFIGEEFRHNFALIVGDENCGTLPLPRVRANMDALPIAGESVDTLIVPHVLEFEPNPHQLLREAERILKPEGQLFVLGFNPWSLYGIVNRFPLRHSFRNRTFIGYHQLMDWLSLLKFDAEFGAGFSAAASQAIFKPDSLLNKSMAYLATAYAVRAIKRTYMVIPVKPAWVSTTNLIPGHVIETPFCGKLDGRQGLCLYRRRLPRESRPRRLGRIATI
ncbi:MAG TPA: class I SAM-dependent methyltransferase [Methylococcaceae bacterium]|nr:class I SAM-dependent methyltransferase [Methylococcaceae bacterium]